MAANASLTSPHASPARTQGPLAVEPHSRRHVTVRLTDWAPGCLGLTADDDAVCKTLWSRTPLDVVRAVLRKLDLAADEVEAGQYGGDPALIGPADPAEFPEQSAPVPLALFWEGLTASELEEALAQAVAQMRRNAAA